MPLFFSLLFFFLLADKKYPREGHPELSKFIEEYDPKDKSGEEEKEDSSDEEEGDILSDSEDPLTPKEKRYRSAVVIFIQSFFAHVFEKKEEDDFSFDAGGSDDEDRLGKVQDTLDENPELFKDLYIQFQKKFQSRSIDDELDQSLRTQISSLGHYDQMALNYFLLFNEECVETNFYEEEKDDERVFFRFTNNFFLSKQKNPPMTAGGLNIRLQFDFS